MTKACGKCGLVKPVDEFGFRYPKRGLRHSWCKACFAEYKRAWYRGRRLRHIAHVQKARADTKAVNQLRVWEYLALHPCVDCGERDIVVLQFDHLREKVNNVGYMCGAGFSWQTIEAEMAKCEVRCANCHMRKTLRANGTFNRKHMVIHRMRAHDIAFLDNWTKPRAVSSAG